MRIVSKRDVVSGLVTGLTTGLIAYGILTYLKASLPLGISPSVLPWLLPILWVLGVQFGYLLGTVLKPFVQFGRFVAIGFANAAVDFGALYLLIAQTGQAVGVAYTVYKSISFAVATVHSYLWNKYWAFEAGATQSNAREVSSFLGVSLVSLLVNVAIASVVNALHPASIAVQSWAGIAAVVGSAAAIVFSFVGFRVFVFKKK